MNIVRVKYNPSSTSMPKFVDDILEVIPDSEVPDFRDMVGEELPLSTYAYNFISTCYKWRKKNPAYDVIFYRYKENVESGVFVGILQSGNKTVGVSPYARKGYEDLLENALMNTSKINWKRLPLIQGILPRHTSLIERVVKEKNYHPQLYVDTTVQLLDSEIALNYKITCPNNVYTRQLRESDVDSIYDFWPHRDVWTIDELKHSINLGAASYGVFSKYNDELLAWVMQVHYGALGMLYTKENVRRHGYAKLLIMLMSKELAKRSIQPYALIMESNIKSITLFHSVGYKLISPMKYICVVEK